MLVVIWYDDLSSRQGFLFLRVAHLADGQRSWDRHDAAGDERLRIDSHVYVGNKHGAGDGGETTAHDLVEFRHGQMGHEGLDQHCAFSLSDKRSSRRDDCLCSRNPHGPEEEDREFADKPLDQAAIVQKLHERHEEDNGGKHREEEHADVGSVLASQECNTVLGEVQKGASKRRDELEDVVSHRCTKHEESHDVLNQHTRDDGVPVDGLSISGCGPESGEENDKAKQADCAVLPVVVCALLTHEGADEDDCDGDCGTGWQTPFLRNCLVDSAASISPSPSKWPHDVTGGNVERDNADGDCEPDEKWDDPVLVVVVKTQACSPPAGGDDPEGEVEPNAVSPIEGLCFAAGFGALFHAA